MFEKEQDLINSFLARLCQSHSPWGELKFIREFDYFRGRTDLVAITDDGNIFAFEAKLLKWREALQQAYRNRCFAHRTYVILPRCTAERAARFLGEFEKRGVGLCYLDDRRIILLHDAPDNVPVQPWLTKIAHGMLSGGSFDTILT